MSFVLTLSCPDRPGLVYAVTRWIVESGGNLLDSQQFTDTSAGRFFLRVDMTFDGARDLAALHDGFAALAGEHAMEYRFADARQPFRTLIMVSRDGHCLNDLLYRQSTGALNIRIPLVVSNHRDLERMAGFYDIPFLHLPVDDASRADAERTLLRLVAEEEIDLVVLARYMQILGDGTSAELAGRAINIHHSFLPSFKGARPYHQAHERGVKLIGATAHYITADLDEGPIIEQEVRRVDHRRTPADLARAGRDVEARTLSRAVGLHTESRVLLNGPRTVVFD